MKSLFVLLTITFAGVNSFGALKCADSAKKYAINLIHFETSATELDAKVLSETQIDQETQEFKIDVINSVGHGYGLITIRLNTDSWCVLRTLTH